MTTKIAGQALVEAQTSRAGEPGGHLVVEAQVGHAARRKSTSFDGHRGAETHKDNAVDAPGQTAPEAQTPSAGGDNLAGQNSPEAHAATAGEPGDHAEAEAQTGVVARQPSSSFDGHQTAEAPSASAVDAPGQVPAEAQTRAAGGAHLAGQRLGEAQKLPAGENGAGRGHVMREAQMELAAVRAAISQIIEIGRQNSFAIRQRMRVKQATLSYIARVYFGYHTKLPDAERKKLMDAATKLIKAIEVDEDHPAVMLVHATSAAAVPWEDIERRTEKTLVKLARKLPAYAWVKDVRGFGALSFARIIAETGDLSGYANPGKVWKRLGLAVYDGKAQRRTRDAEKAVEQGYSPRRRSVVFVAFDPVIRAQSVPASSVGQSGDEAHLSAADGGAGQLASDAHIARAGPYRLIYDAKKAEYIARGEAGEEGWSKLHADRAAKRFASKRLLRDLWTAWRDDIAGQKGVAAQAISAGDSEPEAARTTVKPKVAVPPRARKPKPVVTGQPHGEAQGPRAGDSEARGGQS